jgi:hypothetical protein
VVRIGENADAEQPLQEINGARPDTVPRLRDLTDRDNKNTYPVEIGDASRELKLLKFEWFDPIPKGALPAAQEVWRQQDLSSRMVADFTAAASGELFVYVNDGIQMVPLLGPFDRYYKNNSGSALVTVQRMPLPPSGK